MSFLSHLFAARSFRLAEFEPAPLDFSAEVTAELAELLLDHSIAVADASSTVLAFPSGIPTPGQMHETIERHLEAKDVAEATEAAASPAEELRLALAELRRSLG